MKTVTDLKDIRSELSEFTGVRNLFFASDFASGMVDSKGSYYDTDGLECLYGWLNGEMILNINVNHVTTIDVVDNKTIFVKSKDNVLKLWK